MPVWNLRILTNVIRIVQYSSFFQQFMMSIFSEMIEKIMEVFMDDFTVYRKTFDDCLENLDRVLQRWEEKHLVLTGKNVILWFGKE
jgi:predicted transcriptional regulator